MLKMLDISKHGQKNLCLNLISFSKRNHNVLAYQLLSIILIKEHVFTLMEDVFLSTLTGFDLLNELIVVLIFGFTQMQAKIRKIKIPPLISA